MQNTSIELVIALEKFISCRSNSTPNTSGKMDNPNYLTREMSVRAFILIEEESSIRYAIYVFGVQHTSISRINYVTRDCTVNVTNQAEKVLRLQITTDICGWGYCATEGPLVLSYEITS